MVEKNDFQIFSLIYYLDRYATSSAYQLKKGGEMFSLPQTLAIVVAVSTIIKDVLDCDNDRPNI